MATDHTDNTLAAVCGLYCGACSIYIATNEDPERLQKAADRFNMTTEEASCRGCRSEKLGQFCQDCHFVSCAAERGLEFCGECNDFPCSELQEFQAARPHRNELWTSLKRINEVGSSRWQEESIRHYSCPNCQTINSAYDLQCRNCGNVPSSEFFEDNAADIKKHLNVE